MAPQTQAQTAAPATARTLEVDPTHSRAGFAVKHLMFATVRGHIPIRSARIHLDTADPSRSTVEADLDMAGIDTGVQQRDDHLRSADFFDASAHPTITFRSRHVQPDGALGARVVGDLTIRGVTRETVLDVRSEGEAKDPWGNHRHAFVGETTIDRRDFGLTWNQALEAGGVVVGEKVKISIEIQAVVKD